MKALKYVLTLTMLSLLFSFKASNACEHVGSNIGYIKTQTELALETENLNKAHYLTFKAIKGIYESQEQLNDCGCEQASLHIAETRQHLRMATKANTLEDTQVFLSQAYSKIVESFTALDKHHLHQADNLTLNTIEDTQEINLPIVNIDTQALHQRIDTSLLPYKASLQKVIDSVDCTDARAFAIRIFENCEQELLKQNLSEGKKYYYLKTQEITAEALDKLGDCGLENAK